MKLLNKKTGIVSGICLMAASTVGLAGCKSFSGTDTSTQELDARDYQSFMEHTADVYKEYVTLGNYKDLEITAVDRSDEEATDTDVDEVIQELLSKITTTEDETEGGTTQYGDSIVLNYSGSIDGQAFDGGTAENQTYTVGSGKFISDLDKGLVGLEANKEYDIPVKFPDDYSSEDLKGKDAVFKVKVTKITRTVTPEANDEWVKVNASMFNNYGYGERLIQQKKEQNDIKQFDIAYKQILANATITGYPEEEKNALMETYKENIEAQYKQYGSAYGVSSYDEYIQKVYSKNSEEFDKYVEDTTETYLDEKMIVTLIASENNIKVSTEDITFLGGNLAAYYQFEDFNALIEKYGKKINCELGYQSLYTKVASYIVSVSNVKSSTDTTETTQKTETTETTEATETKSE